MYEEQLLGTLQDLHAVSTTTASLLTTVVTKDNEPSTTFNYDSTPARRAFSSLAASTKTDIKE